MRAIQIDPDLTTVDEVELDAEDLDGAFKRLLGNKFKRLPLDRGHVLLVQKDHQNHEVTNFMLEGIPAVAGLALILGKAVVGYADATCSVEEIADAIRWIDGDVIY